MTTDDWLRRAVEHDRLSRQAQLKTFDAWRANGASARMKYVCEHHHLLARVWVHQEDLWVEGGQFKLSPQRAGPIGILNRASPRRAFDLNAAMLFVGDVPMPDGSTQRLDGTKAIIGCRCRSFVVSLEAIRDDALAGAPSHAWTVVLPDDPLRVVVAEQ